MEMPVEFPAIGMATPLLQGGNASFTTGNGMEIPVEFPAIGMATPLLPGGNGSFAMETVWIFQWKKWKSQW